MKVILITASLMFLSFGAQAETVCVSSKIGVHTDGTTSDPELNTINFRDNLTIPIAEFFGSDIKYNSRTGFSVSNLGADQKAVISRQSLQISKTHSDHSTYSISIVCGFK